MANDLGMRFGKAFEKGMKEEFGEIPGSILGEVVGYFPSCGLDPQALRAKRSDDATKVDSQINANLIDGGMLLKVRSNMIASAVLAEDAEVRRWATVGLSHCTKVDGGGWAQTSSEWQWVIDNPSEFRNLVIELKRFLNQL